MNFCLPGFLPQVLWKYIRYFWLWLRNLKVSPCAEIFVWIASQHICYWPTFPKFFQGAPTPQKRLSKWELPPTLWPDMFNFFQKLWIRNSARIWFKYLLKTFVQILVFTISNYVAQLLTNVTELSSKLSWNCSKYSLNCSEMVSKIAPKTPSNLATNCHWNCSEIASEIVPKIVPNICLPCLY